MIFRIIYIDGFFQRGDGPNDDTQTNPCGKEMSGKLLQEPVWQRSNNIFLKQTSSFKEEHVDSYQSAVVCADGTTRNIAGMCGSWYYYLFFG